MGASLAITSTDWRPTVVRVVAPSWQDAQHRTANTGSFRLRLMAVSLSGIRGTGDTTGARPWRQEALQTGWSVV